MRAFDYYATSNNFGAFRPAKPRLRCLSISERPFDPSKDEAREVIRIDSAKAVAKERIEIVSVDGVCRNVKSRGDIIGELAETSLDESKPPASRQLVEKNRDGRTLEPINLIQSADLS
ncbi:hypothetical protein GCM10023203_39710 [Actinomycetospora straminea]|uniref:PRC-barrel domain protein n=1 Tax=Actinomycetospora straminea TaxID=663607 RepID=A0ABP9ERR1_9PSEU